MMQLNMSAAMCWLIEAEWRIYGRRQAIIWTNAGILLIEPLGKNFSEILIEILTFSIKKIRLKVSSAKRRPFCLGLNVLTSMPRPAGNGGNKGTMPRTGLLSPSRPLGEPVGNRIRSVTLKGGMQLETYPYCTLLSVAQTLNLHASLQSLAESYHIGPWLLML